MPQQHIELSQALAYQCPECQHSGTYIPRQETAGDLYDKIKEATGMELPEGALPKVAHLPEYIRCPKCKTQYSPTMGDAKQMVVGGYELASVPGQMWTKHIRENSKPEEGRIIEVRIDGARGDDDRNLPDPAPGFGRLVLDVPHEAIAMVDYIVEAGGISPARLLVDTIAQAFVRVQEKRGDQ